MRYFKIRYIIALFVAVISSMSCKDTFLMYDLSQKSHLYFKQFDTTNVKLFSMVVSAEDDYEYQIEVQVMGRPTDYDRTFNLKLHNDTLSTYTDIVGDHPVTSVRWQTDVSVDKNTLVLPAGQISTTFPLTIHRTPEMVGNYLSALITVEETDEFRPMVPNYFRLLITDGELTCPVWWTNIYNKPGSTILGWNRYLGKFYPEKYRRYLNLFWDAKAEQPDFVATNIKQYGEFLYANNNQDEVKVGFFMTENKAVWAHYVIIPLYDYYKENPLEGDCDFVNSGTQGEYWEDPRGMIK